MSPKPQTNRSRSPKLNEKEKAAADAASASPSDAAIATSSAGVAFEAMWENQFEAKLDSFKNEVKGAVKNLVVDEMGKFEARIDEKLEKQATEVQGVKAAVDRIEQVLAGRCSASGPADQSFPPPAPPSYAQIAGALPFPSPAPFPGHPPRPQNISPEELNQSKFWRRPDDTVIFANTMANAKVELSKWKTSVEALAADCDLSPGLFKVTGDPLGSRLEVRFLGELSTAASRAKQLLDSLKLGGGKFKEQSVRPPDNTQIHFSQS